LRIVLFILTVLALVSCTDSGITQASHLDFDITITPEAETAFVQTNLNLATRALVLLLDNAKKFTCPPEAAGGAAAVKERGKVVLGVSCTSDPEPLLTFTVEDSGIGIPPEEAEHIFEEFVQLDEYYDGTGIGLTVARSLARRLGGDIVLDTSYSGGARFVYTLPL